MTDASAIREHMEVIGAVGTLDRVEDGRIKLTMVEGFEGQEGGAHTGHHHYISLGLVADVEGDQVRLSATGANALLFEEEEGG